jgi:putative ABC transport system permease protein
VVAVSAKVFTTLGVPLMAGRPFGPADTEAAPRVLVLSAMAARHMFPDGDAIGRTFPFGSAAPGAGDPEIVGIVGDVKYSGLGAAPDGAIYLPYPQRVFKSTYLVVRTAGSPELSASSIRRAILAIEPTTGISGVRSLDAAVSDAVAQPRFRTWLLMLLAGLALVMAAVGLYGVLSYTVAQRTSEIGLRMALGASSGDVMAMIVKQGVALTTAGLAVGSITAYFLNRTLAAFLYGVGPTDVLSFVAAGTVIAVVGVAATFVPTRRAMMVDPLIALRTP